MNFRDEKRGDVSVGASPPPLRDARPIFPTWLHTYFTVLVALTIVAVLPDAIMMGMLLMIVPGLVLLAAPTLLYYSAALLPSFFVNRILGRPPLAALIAIVSLGSAALVPHYASRLESAFAAKTRFRAAYPTRPFYFGPVNCKGGDICLEIARDR